MVAAFRGDEQRLTLRRLCTRIEVDPTTGHRWRQSGKLACFRIGGRWLVSREAWERFIERCNGGSNPTGPIVEGARREAIGV